MSTEGEKRKLVDLRVVDLRAELEKRGLDNKGVKATLIERLQKVLREEGHDAEEYFFEIESVKTPKRTSLKRVEQDAESETQSNADENHETSLDADEEGKEEEEEERENVCQETEVGTGLGAGEEKPSPGDAVKEIKDLTAEEKKGVLQQKDLDHSQDPEKSIPEANGVDNEDSINLTIGEDEEKLLADEVGHEEDSSSQEKEAKDERERAASKAEEGSAAGECKKPAEQEEEDKDSANQDDKIQKAQEEMNDKAGEKGKSVSGNIDQKVGKDEKDKRAKSSGPISSSRNLWVSGLSSSTRATDLKQVFSKYGKVIGAKVVTNARTPGARCYGYVTMATSDDASKCIQHLHRTELHGRMISVERAKGDAGPPRGAKGHDDKKRHERRSSAGGAKADDKDAAKEEGGVAEGSAGVAAAAGEGARAEEGSGDGEGGGTEPGEDGVGAGVEGKGATGSKAAGAAASVDGDKASRDGDTDRDRDRERDRTRRRSAGSSHYSQHSHSRPLSRSPHRRFRPSPPAHGPPHGPPHGPHGPAHASRRPGVLTFTQIREERERQRLRERERELREEDRRRREEMARQREIERRQREEAVRLEREKERLRIERERIESERAELMRLERERQRLEREKLEREREELKRQQMRFEEARRSTKRPSDDRRESYGEDRKRVATERRYEGSQSSRFDENARSNDFEGKKEYKAFPGGGGGGGGGARRAAAYEPEARRGSSRGEGPRKELELPREPRRETSADAGAGAGRGKDSRFERTSSFRVRDERRPESDHRPKVDIRHSARERYPDSAKGERYGERSGEWHSAGGPPPVKAFSSLGPAAGSGSHGGHGSGRDGWTAGERKADGGQGWGRPIDSNSSERWVGGGGGMAVSRGPTMGPMYSGQQSVSSGPALGIGLSGGPYGNERFDYKQSMGPMRKY